ncbi:MAG: hypothetical protein IKT68_06960 [Clostridia bacterium]|nr:hypothetical protein [Clostridia bacterium]
MTHEKNAILFKNTYASLKGRIKENGYAPTSVTGAYPGMFPRDAAEETFALMKNNDYECARKILYYILTYHRKYDAQFGLHVISDEYGPIISDRHQADTTFFIVRAWSMYCCNAPESAQKQEFLSETHDIIRRFVEHWMNNGCFSTELQLLRNPSFEHARDGSYFNSYDLLTNTIMSQALHELSTAYIPFDADFAKYCGEIADTVAKGIHQNLTATVDGIKIYAEMRSLSKESGATFEITEDTTFYEGFSGINFIIYGVDWYAGDPEILENTYVKTHQYCSELYDNQCVMVDAFATKDETGTYRCLGKHTMGKGIAWEIFHCLKTGRKERIEELTAYIVSHSEDMYRETWAFGGGGGDTANQEHASWMINAMKSAYPELEP